MSTFVSGHQRIFYNLLLTAGLWSNLGNVNENDKKITIVSPWLTDLSSENSGWPQELAKQACQTSSDLGSLGRVLAALIGIGYEVRLVVLDTEGKWLSKSNSKMIQNEIEFMRRMNDHGVICQRRRNMHFKWLCTPVGLWKGSSNSTANGLFGRLEEQNEVYLSLSNREAFLHQKRTMELATSHSIPYFGSVSNIKNAKIKLDFPNTEVEINEKPDKSDQEYPPHQTLVNGTYPPFVPLNYAPIGQIDPEAEGTLSPEEQISIMAWINLTVERLTSFIDLVFVVGQQFTGLETKNHWLDSISIRTIDQEVIPLSESEKLDIDGESDNLTSHEILSRIKDKYHILQCCGVLLDKDGVFRPSGGMDAAGVDIRPAYSETLMRYLPVGEDVNNSRVDRLFQLVHDMVLMASHAAGAESISLDFARKLSKCLLEIESKYLNPMEDEY